MFLEIRQRCFFRFIQEVFLRDKAQELLFIGNWQLAIFHLIHLVQNGCCRIMERPAGYLG
jgi:hypothetical protein